MPSMLKTKFIPIEDCLSDEKLAKVSVPTMGAHRGMARYQVLGYFEQRNGRLVEGYVPFMRDLKDRINALQDKYFYRPENKR